MFIDRIICLPMFMYNKHINSDVGARRGSARVEVVVSIHILIALGIMFFENEFCVLVTVYAQLLL